MPQPLSKINHTTPVLFHPKALTERPQLAVLVARAIAGWSEIEGQMGTLLVKMLDSSAKPALAMFSALASAPAQIAVVKAAAETVLDGEANEMVDAVLLLANRAATARHHLAHRVWGYSEAMPDALILADGRDISGHWMQSIAALHKFANGDNPPDVDWPRDKLAVYRDRDLNEIISQMDELYDYFYQLGFLVGPQSPWRDRILAYLNARPQIQEALTRIRKSRKTP
jgi:hypothetical protein